MSPTSVDRRYCFLVAAIAGFALTVTPTLAGVININNPGFENGSGSASGGNWASPVDWTEENAGSVYVDGVLERVNWKPEADRVLYLNANTAVNQDLSHNWSSSDIFTLGLVGHEAGWRVGAAGDAFSVQLRQTDGTILWDSGVQDVDGTVTGLQNNFSYTGTGHIFSWTIDASTFTAGTEGQPLNIRIVGISGTPYIDDVALEFTPADPDLPSVEISPATGVGATSVTLNGAVTDIGIAAPTITFYYGDEDGGQDPGAWDSSVVLPGTHNGAFSQSVSGLSPVTLYYFGVLATNSGGSSWATGTESFTTFPQAPAVDNVAASSVEASSAEVGATVTATGGEAPALTIYYGTSDGGTNAGSWTASVSLGTADTGGTTTLGGLSHGMMYYHRAFVSNGGGSAWASSSASFTTAVAAPASVINRSAADISGSTARLRGTVIATGNDTPSLTFYFGTSDGGTVEGAWERSVFAGADNGDFSKTVTLLIPETNYFFRARAVNAAGTSWASSSETFTTTVASTLGVVINEVHHDADLKTERAEFVELLNAGDATVDLSGWRLEGVGDYIFPGGTSLAAGQYLVIAEDVATMLTKFGVTTTHEYSGGLDNDGDDLRLIDDTGTEIERVNYKSGFPWPTAARGTGASMELIHPALDNDLGGSWRSASSGLPTPGAANSEASTTANDAPPAIRQVEHSPQTPAAGQTVAITAKVTDPDGIGPVTLSYQLVEPGSYIRKGDASYATTWTDVPMADNGTGGDVLVADGVFTATLSAGLQVHRRLVRYRITVEDALGNNVQVPYADDESPNFAYFVYDGVPAWSGAKQPGTTSPETIPAAVMADSQPVYHLIGNSTDVTNSQYSSASDGVRMSGSLVYDGVVYDHIEFYNRGEYSTYVSGKNKWRFRFNRARDFEARNIHGQRYATKWKTMNFNACASPWQAANRGMAGFDEAVPQRLNQLAGVPSSNTHWVHFRVVDSADEAPANQYSGDLWGLYLAIEHPDGRFLEERGLADGNVYKIEGIGDQKNQGPTQPSDGSDWTSFSSASGSLNSVAWWRANFDLDGFYGFRAINRATGNVDLRDTANYYMYHNPDGRWQVIPWDMDMMYVPETHWSGVIRADTCLGHSEISIEFKNRCRELLDLLFSDIDRHGGQASQLVEELSQVINPTGVPLTMVDADEFTWSYHPRTKTDHRGPWYATPKSQWNRGGTWTRSLLTPDHEGFQQNMIDYMFDTRTGGGFAVGDGDEDGYGFGYLSQEASDAAIPDQPTITYTGDAGFPANGLRFTSETFSDPQGAGSFASMEWRVGEIYNPMTPGYLTDDAWIYEVTEFWNSGELTPFVAETTIPTSSLRPGHTYRARVRHWDDTGRASHWSDPVEFVAGLPLVAPYQDSLVISEIMYNPAGGSDHEFVELHNVGATTVDLTGVRFTKGIDYDFPNGTTIAPGAYLLVVKNRAAFQAEYGSGLPVAGVWDVADNLSNGGENLKLSLGAGTAIHEFVYDDAHPWPTAPDGSGFSLTLACMESGVNHADPGVWRASVAWGGSPGTDDSTSINDWLTDYGLSAGDELLDGDGDSLLSLLEYAIGTNPTIPDNSDAFVISMAAGETLFSYHRSRTADGVTVIAEYSFDLSNWSPAEIVTTNDLGSGLDQVTVRRFGPGSGETQGFFRLRVELK